ncbi:MAG: aldehyde dehydrogenase family protein, partial [Parvularcula sp.]|nr:aldehyde dehydrogenase family protein [Parvularcula sp.]
MTMSIESRNPATGESHARFDELTDDAIENALQSAEEGVERLRLMGRKARADGLMRLADVLDDRKDELARIATEEMGKTLASAKAEVSKCAAACRYYAEHGPSFLADEAVKIDEGSAYVATLPLGPILAVMPWNFPYWQVFRFAAPSLMLGNSGLLKHASNVPRCALAIEETIRQAGFPE